MRAFLLVLFPLLLAGQSDSLNFFERGKSERYRVPVAISLPYIGLGGWGSQQRLISLQNKPGLTQTELEALDPNDVPGIDQWALRQSFAKHKRAIIQSDYIFNTGQWLPFGLIIWEKYRKDWLDIGLMYLEAQVTQGLFYGFAPFGPTLVDRYRPRVYYDDNERTDGNQRNSMFSGHVSTSLTGFYFAARMIDDYNPQLTGGQRALLYTGATLPGIAMGYLRVRALKHYPTDVLIGMGVGAIAGIGVPSLHKWWRRRHESRLAVLPVYGAGAGGLSFVLRY